MVCRWIEIDKFDFDKETEFECYIFMDGAVRKARYAKATFTFNFGFCGRNVPTHVMKIPVPKQPTIKM